LRSNAFHRSTSLDFQQSTTDDLTRRFETSGAAQRTQRAQRLRGGRREMILPPCPWRSLCGLSVHLSYPAAPRHAGQDPSAIRARHLPPGGSAPRRRRSRQAGLVQRTPRAQRLRLGTQRDDPSSASLAEPLRPQRSSFLIPPRLARPSALMRPGIASDRPARAWRRARRRRRQKRGASMSAPAAER
jgi:hypothetical protein